MAKSQTLEEAFEQLETLIGQLEDGSVSLNEAFKMYNEGVKLIKNCNTQLDKIEKQIIILDSKEDGADGI